MIEAIGLLLAVAAALDFALKAPLKARVASWLTSLATYSSPINQAGYQYVSSIFGPALFSKRAIIVSLAISATSLGLSYFYAFVTSDFDVVWIFEDPPSASSLMFFAAFFVGCMLGDILSYAQNRLFLKTVDDYKIGVISVGLALADAIVSLALFVFTFSFIRMACYLIIISGLSGGELTSTQAINLDLLKDKLPRLVQKGLVRDSEIDWLGYLAVAETQDSSSIDSVLRNYNQKVVGDFEKNKGYSLKAEVVCVPSEMEISSRLDTVQLVAKATAGARAIGELDEQFKNIRADVGRELSDWKPASVKGSDAKCAFRALVIKRKMTPARLMDIAGPVNAWWAAFEMTLFDTYSSVAYKFGPYVNVDPFNDIDRFYESVTFQSGYSFFDLTFADPTIPYLLSEFRYRELNESEVVRVPYSPMLASSLGVSICFWLYIFVVFVSKGVQLITSFNASIFQRFDVSTSPFTSTVLVLVAIIAMWYGLSFGLDVFWNFVF